MDFGLSDEQKLLKKTARDFLKKKCPKTLVREMDKDERGYSLDLWRDMVGLGWPGLLFPEQYGGGGGNFLDLMVLLEEMGRFLLPGPLLSTVLASSVILAAGSEEQKREFLPQIASGQMMVTLALFEPGWSYNADSIAVEAAFEDDDYVVTGTKLFVDNAHVADYIICAARTGKEKTGEQGISLFLIDQTSHGITSTLLKTVGGDKQCEVVFDKVKVPKRNILGERGLAWPHVVGVVDKAVVAQSVLLLGSAEEDMVITANYAKERRQFGRPIGSYQALQHLMADMATDLEGARNIIYKAGWKLSEGLPCTLEVARAKAWISDVSQRISIESHNICLGVSLSLDHDMPLYFSRIARGVINLGDSNHHREIIAKELLD